MQKSTKLKLIFVLLDSLFISSLFFNGLFCIAETDDYCFLGYYVDEILQPLLMICVSFFITLIFTFFISPETFKKWLIYFFAWLIVDVLWVASADTTSDYFGLVPTKETASIYMGFILVYTSLIWFILSKFQWQTWIKWLIAVPTFIIAVVLTFALS